MICRQLICKRCGSQAVNRHLHGRDGSDGDLCDVCYWRKRAESKVDLEELAKAFVKKFGCINDCAYEYFIRNWKGGGK